MSSFIQSVFMATFPHSFYCGADVVHVSSDCSDPLPVFLALLPADWRRAAAAHCTDYQINFGVHIEPNALQHLINTNSLVSLRYAMGYFYIPWDMPWDISVCVGWPDAQYGGG